MAVGSVAIGVLVAAAQTPAPEKQAPEKSATATKSEPDTTSTSVAVKLAPPLDPQELKRRLSTLFEGALLDTSNDQDFVQSQGYMKLLELVALEDPALAHEKASKKRLDWEAAMQDPNAWRGEWVHYRGPLAGDFAAERLASPVHGYSDYWRGVIVDAREDEPGQAPDETGGVVFDMLAPPADATDFDRNDTVEIEGVFYRTVSFETRAKGKFRTAPYLIVRNLTHYHPDANTKTKLNVWAIILIAGGGVLFIYHLTKMLRDESKKRARLGLDKSGADFHRMFQERAHGKKPGADSGSPH